MTPTPQQLFEMERTAKDALSYNPFDVDGDMDNEICEKIARLFWERHVRPMAEALQACMAYMPCSEVHNWPPGWKLKDEAIKKAKAALSKVEVRS